MSMKAKTSGWDTFIYVLLCIFTVGAAWLMRIVISQAIRCAIQEEKS
jgi:hypothetical protein